MTMRILITTIFIGLFCPIKAQNYWSFDSCLNYALEHNIQLEIQKLTVQIDKINYRQSYLNFLPYADANASHSLNAGKSVDVSNYTYINKSYKGGSIGIGGQLSLFNGFQDINTVIKSRYDLFAGYLNIEKNKIDITINILNSYLNILFLNDLLLNVKNQLAVSIVQTQKTKLLMDLGKLSYKDLLELKAQEANDRELFITTDNDLSKSYLILTQYMSCDTLSVFHIQGNSNIGIDTSVINQSFSEIFNDAQLQLPDMKIANYQFQSSKKSLSILRGQRLPSLSLSGSYSSWYSDLSGNPRSTTANPMKYSYWDQINDNLSSQISFNLHIPIFNRFNLQSNVSRAKVDIDISWNKLEQEKQVLFKTIQQLYADAKSANAKYNSKNETFISMDELYKYSEEQYQHGMISSIDYKISKNNMTKAYANLIQAKYELIYKTKVLVYFTTGKIGL